MATGVLRGPPVNLRMCRVDMPEHAVLQRCGGLIHGPRRQPSDMERHGAHEQCVAPALMLRHALLCPPPSQYGS